MTMMDIVEQATSKASEMLTCSHSHPYTYCCGHTCQILCPRSPCHHGDHLQCRGTVSQYMRIICSRDILAWKIISPDLSLNQTKTVCHPSVANHQAFYPPLLPDFSHHLGHDPCHGHLWREKKMGHLSMRVSGQYSGEKLTRWVTGQVHTDFASFEHGVIEGKSINQHLSGSKFCISKALGSIPIMWQPNICNLVVENLSSHHREAPNKSDIFKHSRSTLWRTFQWILHWCQMGDFQEKLWKVRSWGCG